MLRPILIVSLLAALTLNAPVARTQAGGPATVSSVSHGIRVTLTVPRLQYPLNALAVFMVTVTNVSRSNRYLQDFQPDYGGPYSPHILMRTPGGSLIYEEELSQFLAPSPGDLGTNYVLHPGASLTRHVRFVLGAADVQAVTRVANGYTGFSARKGTPTPPPSAWATALWHISSPWIHLSLITEPPPAVTVTRSGTRIHVAVKAPWPVTGPMFYMDSARCWFSGSVESTDQHVPWMQARGNAFTSKVTPHCPSSQPWHAVVGWADRPVARISYATIFQIR